MIIANVEDKGLRQITNFPIPGFNDCDCDFVVFQDHLELHDFGTLKTRVTSLAQPGLETPLPGFNFQQSESDPLFYASTFSLILYLDGEELEAELIEGQEEVISFGNILVAFFFIIASQSSRTLFQDDVTAFAKLDPTDRVQHVVCEAKNEV